MHHKSRIYTVFLCLRSHYLFSLERIKVPVNVLLNVCPLHVPAENSSFETVAKFSYLIYLLVFNYSVSQPYLSSYIQNLVDILALFLAQNL